MAGLTALNFFATGSYQTAIACNIHRSGISQAYVGRAVAELVDALNRSEDFNAWVKFLNTVQQLRATRTRFFDRYGIPGIIGVIDYTHVAIISPAINDPLHPEHIYINRKNYHSLNVQLISDDNLRIINVNVSYPGSTHDSYICDNSHIRDELITFRRRNPGFYLIGDSGYTLRPWMQTPLRDAISNTPEFRYNEEFKRARATIERCHGVLKMRFRCLLKHRVFHYTPSKEAKIVNACVVLHNMCITNNVPEPDGEEGDGNLGFSLYENPVIHVYARE